MNDIKVSVICNVFNQIKYIEKTLFSIVNQNTNFKYEILVHDDVSTDGTIDILKKFEADYPELFNVIYQKENQYRKNISAWLDIQIPRAKGKYIAFCDGDDYWYDTNKLQKQVDALESQLGDFCYTDFSIFYEQKNIYNHNIFQNKISSINSNIPLLTFGILGVPTWMITKQFFIELKKPDYFIKDSAVYIIMELLRSRKKIIFLKDNTATYRRNSGSTSNEINDFLRYEHHKSVFVFMLDYYEAYYKNEVHSKSKIVSLAVNLVSEAHDHLDLDLLERIKIFLLESNIDITQILNKFNDKDKYKKNFESLDNSKIRKLIKYLKNILNKR